MLDPITLHTRRLSLTAPRDSDGEAVFVIHSDPRTYEHAPDLVMRTRAEAAKLVRMWQENWSRDGVGYFTVALHQGPIIGFCGLRVMTSSGSQVLNTYYRFRPESQGQGYATEATRAAIAWGTARYPDLPVVATIAPSNTASLGLARKLGFVSDPSAVTDPEDHPRDVTLHLPR